MTTTIKRAALAIAVTLLTLISVLAPLDKAEAKAKKIESVSAAYNDARAKLLKKSGVGSGRTKVSNAYVKKYSDDSISWWNGWAEYHWTNTTFRYTKSGKKKTWNKKTTSVYIEKHVYNLDTGEQLTGLFIKYVKDKTTYKGGKKVSNPKWVSRKGYPAKYTWYRTKVGSTASVSDTSSSDSDSDSGSGSDSNSNPSSGDNSSSSPSSGNDSSGNSDSGSSTSSSKTVKRLECIQRFYKLYNGAVSTDDIVTDEPEYNVANCADISADDQYYNALNWALQNKLVALTYKDGKYYIGSNTAATYQWFASLADNVAYGIDRVHLVWKDGNGNKISISDLSAAAVTVKYVDNFMSSFTSSGMYPV